jgi:hypothetical protein
MTLNLLGLALTLLDELTCHAAPCDEDTRGGRRVCCTFGHHHGPTKVYPQPLEECPYWRARALPKSVP